jgi:protein TonB
MIILMENSKNASLSLYAKRPLFFNLGLVIAITLCFIAFEFKVYITDEETVKLPDQPDVLFVMQEVKNTVQPPKVKPDLVQPKKEILPNIVDKKPEEPANDEAKVEAIDLDGLKDLVAGDAPAKEEVESAPVDPWALENQPNYKKGGLEAFYQYLASEIEYPKKEQRMGVEGKVYLSFIIEKDGSLTDIKVLKGISEGLDTEAVRVLKASPHWEPGKQRGQPVRVRMTIPINFQLN